MSLLPRKFSAFSVTSAVVATNGAATAQRLRLGITGLAAVFLIVLIAAAGMRPAQSLAAPGAGSEPLAQLGVAPSSAHETAARGAPQTKPTRI